MEIYVAALAVLYLFKESNGCSNVCVSVGVPAQFSYNLTVPGTGLVSYEVSKGSTQLLSFIYNGGSLVGSTPGTDVTITGDLSTGDIAFTLSNVVAGDAGTYTLKNDVTFEEFDCAVLTIPGTLTATITADKNEVEDGSDITFTCSHSTTTLPSDVAVSYSWMVDSASVTESGSTYTRSVKVTDNSKKVTCTVTESCGASDTSSEITLNVTGGSSPSPGPCCVWICFIGLIVTVVLCSGKLGLYFCKILVFQRILSIEFGIKIATPSAAICLAGILLGTLLCVLASGCDDEKTWGTAVGVVLVICCPCCSVGIIIIHFKMKNEGTNVGITETGLQEQRNSGNDGGSSCFSRNNSILPICAGTDQQPRPSRGGQGQGGQHTAKGQTKLLPDHGRQKPDGDNGKHLDSGKARPLPIPDKDDGLQKSKTEKSGSVVSKGDVDIDEALQFKPRKLPEIPPGGEKSIRGISANFDEVVPDKKRLTPIGKETIEKFDEESPRKKKKKKKDKGKDTSIEYDTDL